MPDKTAALVTPDRALARRVLAALARWNVPVDDSGGDALRRHAGRRVRAAGRRGGARRARAGDAAGAAQASAVRLDAARGLDAGARGAARAAAEAPARAGLAHALQTFRDELEKFRRKEPSIAAPLRSAHGDRRDAELDAAAGAGRAAQAPRWRRWKRCRQAPQPFARASPRVIADGAARALGGIDGEELAERVRRDRRAAGALADRAAATMPSCSTPRSPTARCAGREAGRARAHLRPARSAAAVASIAWCSAAWSKASGRRRRAAIPGSAGRCATSSASICRSGASGSRRTISRRRSARPR